MDPSYALVHDRYHSPVQRQSGISTGLAISSSKPPPTRLSAGRVPSRFEIEMLIASARNRLRTFFRRRRLRQLSLWSRSKSPSSYLKCSSTRRSPLTSWSGSAYLRSMLSVCKIFLHLRWLLTANLRQIKGLFSLESHLTDCRRARPREFYTNLTMFSHLSGQSGSFPPFVLFY